MWYLLFPLLYYALMRWLVESGRAIAPALILLPMIVALIVLPFGLTSAAANALFSEDGCGQGMEIVFFFGVFVSIVLLQKTRNLIRRAEAK